MNTAQTDIIALGVSTGVTAATVAGLVITQASQDVTIASQGVSIGILQGDVNVAEVDIVALQNRTSDMTWVSLSKTTFSAKVNVGSTASGITLNTNSISDFGSGIKTDTINSDNTMTLTADGFAINANTAIVQTFATTSSLFQSTTTTTLTSGGMVEVKRRSIMPHWTSTLLER